MVNGIWQGQLLDADEVAVTEEFETKIRKAGANHELRCTDPECKCFICYKHGKKRKPHFAHIGESECAYAKFEKQDTSDKKSVRSALYTHFTGLGYDVKREVRLPNGRKYCDLLLNINNQSIVLSIASSTTSAKYIEEYTKECEQSDCKLLWIAIGDPYDMHFEKHHYHAMRYQFNHTTNKNLLIIDSDATIVSQIKEDDTRYEYKRQTLDYRYFTEGVHNFQLIRPVSKLRIVDGELTIDNFFDEYNAWIERKQAAFSKMKAVIDAEDVRREEAEKLRAKLFEESRKRRLQMQQIQTSRQSDNRNSDKSNTPLIPYKQIGATSTRISDYSVGTKVLHSTYGYGEIIEFQNKPYASNHLIRIKYNDGRINSYELEVLIKNELISVI